jgi:bla regulator protein BlaR1
MENIFNAVLITSAYAAIVGLIIVLVKGLLKNKLNAKWQYLIWIILILKLLVPFGPESTYSLFNAVPEISYSSTSNLDNNTIYSDRLNTSANVIVPKEEPANIEVNPERATSLRQNLIPYVWAGGMLLMLLWLTSSYLSLNRKIQRTSVAPDDRILQVYNECKIILGVKRNIPILIQEAVSMPSIFGVFKPKILLSPVVVKLSDKELEYILMHEIAHYKRMDIFANYLLLVLQMVHWFNPVLWYCFKCIRQDMELATDELVLSKLQHAEHRDYGRALITILEEFSTPKLAPRLLAMADDKKNIEKRIKMIKMAEVFRGKRKVAVIVGVLCIALLSGILLTNGIKEQDTTFTKLSPYNAVELYKYKTPYVGDNTNVANLIGSLPYGEFVKGVSLQTKKEPYGITVEYDFKDAEIEERFVGDDITQQFYNAAIAFALIDNVDVIEFHVVSAKEKHIWKRAAVQKNFKGDLRENAKTIEGFSAFIQNIVFKISVTPERYSLAMSSTPGMQLTALYMGNAKAKSVVFTAQSGSLFIWEVSSGKISEHKQKLEVPLGSDVYWSPIGIDDKMIPEEQDGIIMAALLDKNGKKLAETQVTILYERGTYYNVKPLDEIMIPLQPEKPQSIDEAYKSSY